MNRCILSHGPHAILNYYICWSYNFVYYIIILTNTIFSFIIIVEAGYKYGDAGAVAVGGGIMRVLKAGRDDIQRL